MSENAGCLGGILRLFGAKTPEPPTLPYRRRDDFLSPAELSFYRALLAATGERATVLTKVNLADIFFVVRPNENQAYRNKIDRKHVDFLLCEAASMRPALGIELDDSSHQRSQRQARDEFVDEVFRVAGLPLKHVPTSRTYSVPELSAEIGTALAGEATSAVPPASSSATETHAGTPACPNCGSTMVVRTASKGERQGESFYGCPNFPKCRGTLPYTSGERTA